MKPEDIKEIVDELLGQANLKLIDSTDERWQHVETAADGDTWYLKRRERDDDGNGVKSYLYYFTKTKPTAEERKVELPDGYTVKWMPYLVKE